MLDYFKWNKETDKQTEKEINFQIEGYMWYFLVKFHSKNENKRDGILPGQVFYEWISSTYVCM